MSFGIKRCRLTKVTVLVEKPEGKGLRTDSVTGEFSSMPEVGKRFFMAAEPLTEGAAVRLLSTSGVRTITKLGPNIFRLETHHTVYDLEVFDG